MNDAIHKVLSGSPATRDQLICAGLFVGFWFLIDFIEWVDWLIQKFTPIAMCIK